MSILDNLTYKVQVQNGDKILFMTHFQVGEDSGPPDDVALKVGSDLLIAALTEREVRRQYDEFLDDEQSD